MYNCLKLNITGITLKSNKDFIEDPSKIWKGYKLNFIMCYVDIHSMNNIINHH